MTDPTPTPLDLDAIEKRKADATELSGQLRGYQVAIADETIYQALIASLHSGEDVPALVAEVRRLRAVIEAAPHDHECELVLYPELDLYPSGDSICDCWKRDALAGATP